MTTPDTGMEVVEIGARAAYAENDWWRSLAHDDDGQGRYAEMNGVRMRAVEWEELDADDRDSRLKEMRTALTAIEASGRWKLVPVEPVPEGAANYADIALQDAQIEHYSGGHKIWIYDDALFAKSLAGNGFAIVSLSASPKTGGGG